MMLALATWTQGGDTRPQRKLLQRWKRTWLKHRRRLTALKLQRNIENAGAERLKQQKSKVEKIQSDIDKNNSEINRHKEKERLGEEKEKSKATFKEIEQKAFLVQENFEKTQEMLEKHKEVLDEAKSEYDKVKKTVEELRASEVDADFKLKDHLEKIQVDLVDHEKVHATLAENNPNEACNLKRALEMVEELNKVTQEWVDVKKQYDEWRKRRLDEFMAGFNVISLKLKEMYQMITFGGDAELEPVDSLDHFSEGLVFSVRPPKKSWKNIANLSDSLLIGACFCSSSL
ncbi:hypothetical protein K1719_007560 [Acacia pycnantha]|nr:hypothetical protein K1719_007560 [Acacia pycnantha]